MVTKENRRVEGPFVDIYATNLFFTDDWANRSGVVETLKKLSRHVYEEIEKAYHSGRRAGYDAGYAAAEQKYTK